MTTLQLCSQCKKEKVDRHSEYPSTKRCLTCTTAIRSDAEEDLLKVLTTHEQRRLFSRFIAASQARSTVLIAMD